MKQLTEQQLAGLIASVGATQEQEINCSECAVFVAEFAERQHAGLAMDETLARVEQHLVICPECREELLALKEILQTDG